MAASEAAPMKLQGEDRERAIEAFREYGGNFAEWEAFATGWLAKGRYSVPAPLIQEGEGIPLVDAVGDFVRAGEHLLEIQRQAEPMGCSVLKSVRVDGELATIVSQYRGSLNANG